jgi:hypothetical protein
MFCGICHFWKQTNIPNGTRTTQMDATAIKMMVAMFFTPQQPCLSRHWVAIGADIGDIQLHRLLKLEIMLCRHCLPR